MIRVLAIATVLASICGSLAAQAPLTIVESTLPPLTSGVEFRVPLHATGGVPPYRWDIADGLLPEGIAFSHDGVLSGRPIKAAPFTITILLLDSSRPAHSVQKSFSASVNAGLLLDWLQPPHARDNRIDGSVKVSNGSKDTFDLTVIIEAVAENGRATAIGYEHFPRKPGVTDVPISFGTTLPHGGYVVHADAVAEIPARNNLLRQRLQTSSLQVAAGP